MRKGRKQTVLRDMAREYTSVSADLHDLKKQADALMKTVQNELYDQSFKCPHCKRYFIIIITSLYLIKHNIMVLYDKINDK